MGEEELRQVREHGGTHRRTVPPHPGAVLRLSCLASIALLASLTFASTCAAGSDPARLRIVTTTTDLRSLAQEVAGNLADVVSLVPLGRDPEGYEPRPRDLDVLLAARLVVRIGLDFDLWLDRLLAEQGNRDLRRGGIGHVDASTGIALLDVLAQSLGPQLGHAHGVGNPHYTLDPANAEPVTGSILDGLSRIDPGHAATYRANRSAFLAKFSREMASWKRDLTPLQGIAAVAYHNTWSYYARRYRLHIVALIEPREGVPPSPAHLADVIQRMDTDRIRLILMEPYAPGQAARMLASRAGARIAVLAPNVGALPGTGSYLSLFRTNATVLLQAVNP